MSMKTVLRGDSITQNITSLAIYLFTCALNNNLETTPGHLWLWALNYIVNYKVITVSTTIVLSHISNDAMCACGGGIESFHYLFANNYLTLYLLGLMLCLERTVQKYQMQFWAIFTTPKNLLEFINIWFCFPNIEYLINIFL